MVMRVFFMLLIFSIGFSGYSAAAHAFAPDSCNPAMQAEMSGQGVDMVDCADHQDAQDNQAGTDQDKNSDKICLDCTHCCASHSMSLSNYDFGLPEPEASRLSPALEASHNSDFIASMLRPPRSLV